MKFCALIPEVRTIADIGGECTIKATAIPRFTPKHSQQEIFLKVYKNLKFGKNSCMSSSDRYFAEMGKKQHISATCWDLIDIKT